MDPLTIITGCAGLASTIAHTTRVIATFVHDTREARSDMEGVSRELLSLQVVLNLIRDGNDNPEKMPSAMRTRIKEIMSNCESVIREIQAVLARYQKESVLSGASWAMMGRGDVARLTSNLEAHRSALDLGLDVITLTLAKDLKSDTTEILADTTEIKNDTARILAEIQRLRSQLPSNEAEKTNLVLERYLEEMTTYTESALEPTGSFQRDSEYDSGSLSADSVEIASPVSSCSHADTECRSMPRKAQILTGLDRPISIVEEEVRPPRASSLVLEEPAASKSTETLRSQRSRKGSVGSMVGSFLQKSSLGSWRRRKTSHSQETIPIMEEEMGGGFHLPRHGTAPEVSGIPGTSAWGQQPDPEEHLKYLLDEVKETRPRAEKARRRRMAERERLKRERAADEETAREIEELTRRRIGVERQCASSDGKVSQLQEDKIQKRRRVNDTRRSLAALREGKEKAARSLSVRKQLASEQEKERKQAKDEVDAELADTEAKLEELKRKIQSCKERQRELAHEHDAEREAAAEAEAGMRRVLEEKEMAVNETETGLQAAMGKLREAEERFAKQSEDYQGWRDELDRVTRRRQKLVAGLEERKRQRNEGWEVGVAGWQLDN